MEATQHSREPVDIIGVLRLKGARILKLTAAVVHEVAAFPAENHGVHLHPKVTAMDFLVAKLVPCGAGVIGGCVGNDFINRGFTWFLHRTPVQVVAPLR